ncbi:hypothetical protein [Hallella absiana]|uniref:hypothetical protein n=1 Tax=Hallella absiana TaxID=2925336 RepID=UPI0021C65657|nr:hypothetical protein [Hallella absiana]
MSGREKNCKWYFSDQPNGQEVGPNNAMEQSFRRNPYASLVRESIQNSLDAVLHKDGPVVVKYSFKEINGADFPAFFEIQKHIKGCIDYYPNNSNAKSVYGPMLDWFNGETKYHEKIGYIRVSDFNTKGMKYKEGDTDTPFYAFVRSAGVSSKGSESAGGSFGFGKAAYFLLSPISTILVSTYTNKEDSYFEGISSLCTHLYEGSKKMAVGYYDSNNGRPVCDETEIPAPFRRSEPGTDINIMGFDFRDKEEAITEMKEAVLRNFWMAIYNGRLEVQIDEDFTINKANIEEVMEETFPNDEDATKKAGCYNPRPYFDAFRLSGTSDKYVLTETKLPMLGHVQLFINKQKGANDKVIFMRELQMLVFSKRTKTPYGFYGVFYCDDKYGNELLRKMENPAHDEWKASNWRSAGKMMPQGRSALQIMENFIAHSLTDIFVQKDKTAINIKGLEEFLYIPTNADEDDDDSENEAMVGNPTGKLKDEGSSYTTDIPKTDNNPTISSVSQSSSTGHVVISKPTTATASTTGPLRSGRSDKPTNTKGPGIKKPSSIKEHNTETADGERGIFATPIDMRYRTFSQTEGGNTYHYVVLHSDEDLANVNLHFYAVGEDSDEELQVVESNVGNVNGSIIQNVHVPEGRLRLRVRFSDNMKHSIKMTAEELNEVQ